jgi:hypothetical protein
MDEPINMFFLPLTLHLGVGRTLLSATVPCPRVVPGDLSMRYFLLAATLAIAVLILIGILGVICFDVSAMAEPGRAESYIASAGRHFLIRRASRAEKLPASAEIQVDLW